MFFFFFFENTYHHPIVKQAFENICLKKMLIDGYVDMRRYTEGKINRLEFLIKLQKESSVVAELFKSEYSSLEESTALLDDVQKKIYRSLTYSESDAIVYWVCRSIDEIETLETIFAKILGDVKEAHTIPYRMEFKKGIPYNSEKVDLKFISSLSDFNKIIAHVNPQEKLFYRGHSKANYLLSPSVFRTSSLKENESNLYNELIIECPHNFPANFTHLDRLVEMQHYGLPTRLLDITKNPLVALYFACAGNEESLGELILLSTKNHVIKLPQSDCVSILASLPLFSYAEQKKFYDAANDRTLSSNQFNDRIGRLIHEVRQEKPAFLSQVVQEDLLKNYIVYALKNNQRIVKQDGAFIICGLGDFEINSTELSLNKFRYRRNGKSLIILIENKKKILNGLSAYSINKATLFPEIDNVAQHIKDKYSK